MELRKLGSNDIRTSLLGLGGGQFAGSDHSVTEICKIIRKSWEYGINFLDTAKDYGEDRIGEALSELDFKPYVSSKTLAKDGEKSRKDVEDSLDKLNREKIDFYFIHNPMSLEDYRNRKERGVLDALVNAKKEGKIDYVGVSCDYVEPLEEAIFDGIDIIMTHYNAGNTLAIDVIDQAAEKGIGVIAAKSLAGGILVDSKTDIEKGKENKMSPERAFKFVLSNENISSALVGARYPREIEECAKSLQDFKPLSQDRLEELKRSVLDFLGEDFCRDCRYCWPCGELGYEFDISEILRFLDRYEKYEYKRFPRIGFSKLPFRDKIDKADSCELYCPFKIDPEKRLRDAKRKLSLQITEKRWQKEKEVFKDLDNEVLAEVIDAVQNKEAEDAINHIHTHLIPSGKLEEDKGMLLIEALFSFEKDRILEDLENLVK